MKGGMHVLTVAGSCWSLKFRKINESSRRRWFYPCVNILSLSVHAQRACKMDKSIFLDLQAFLNIFAQLAWLSNSLLTTLGSVDTVSLFKTIFEVNGKQEIRNKNKLADQKNYKQAESEHTTELYMKAKVVLFCFFWLFLLLLLSLPSVLCRLQTETQALLGSSVTTSVTSQTSKTQPRTPSDT